jgi:hypothetical protein
VRRLLVKIHGSVELVHIDEEAEGEDHRDPRVVVPFHVQGVMDDHDDPNFRQAEYREGLSGKVNELFGLLQGGQHSPLSSISELPPMNGKWHLGGRMAEVPRGAEAWPDMGEWSEER